MSNKILPDLWLSRIAACAANGITAKDWCHSERQPEHPSTDLCEWMGVSVLEPVATPCITHRIGNLAPPQKRLQAREVLVFNEAKAKSYMRLYRSGKQ